MTSAAHETERTRRMNKENSLSEVTSSYIRLPSQTYDENKYLIKSHEFEAEK